MKDNIAILKELIFADKIEEALGFLKSFDESNEIIQLLSRWQSIKKSQILGVVSFDEFNTEINRVRKSILDYLDFFKFEESKGKHDTLKASLVLNADDYYNSGDYTSAMIEYKKILNFGYEDNDILYKFCHCLVNLSALTEAMSVCDLIEKKFPELHKFQNMKGVIYDKKGLKQRALIYFKNALNLLPNSELYFKNVFYNMLGTNNFDELTEFTGKYILKYPNSSFYYYMKSKINANLAIDYALQDITIAISLNPGHSMYYHDRAMLWAKKGSIEMAAMDLDTAYSITPDISYVKLKGAIFHDSGDYQNACVCYSKVIDTIPNDNSTYYNRSDVLFKLKQYKNAMYDIQQARKGLLSISDFNDLIHLENKILDFTK